MGTASPFRNGSCPFVLPPGSTPYRQPPIIGRAVAIFFALQPPTTWASHACPWLKIALHLGLADCELSFFEDGVARTVKLSGENVCFLGAREIHSVRWKNESPMVWIFVDEDYEEVCTGVYAVSNPASPELRIGNNYRMAPWGIFGEK